MYIYIYKLSRFLNVYYHFNSSIYLLMLHNGNWSQHGFRQGRSTVTNLLECDARVADFLNSNTPCDLITSDFSCAFDKVGHKIKCDKLKSAGFYGSYTVGYSRLFKL